MKHQKVIGIIILGLLCIAAGGAIIFFNFQLQDSLYSGDIIMLERDVPEEFLQKKSEITSDNFSSYGVVQLLNNQIKIARIQNMQFAIEVLTDTILGILFIILGLTIVCFGLIIKHILWDKEKNKLI